MTQHKGGGRLTRRASGGLFVLAVSGSAFGQVVTTCPAGMNSTQLFSYTGAPQTFVVPANVTTLRIISVGADGGERTESPTTFHGGSGAQVEGTFTVAPGQTITAIVGQAPTPTNLLDAGGGGASGAYIAGTLANIGGAGGGSDNTGNGGGGTSTNNGGDGAPPAGGDCAAGGLGGTAGAGGQFGELPGAAGCQTGDGGAGGGGFSAAGGSGPTGLAAPRVAATGGARCNIAGAAGGVRALADPTTTPASNGANGGFGVCGGGGSDHRESGGGGGYSGGGGGPEGVLPGGGGSFVAAAATTPTLIAGASGGGTGRNGSVRLCWPGADLSVSKTDGVAAAAPGGTLTYTVVVSNAGPMSANGATFTDPVATGLNKTGVSCVAAGSAACPAGVTVAQIQAGVAIPTLPSGGSVTFTITATVTGAAGTNVTNTATVSTPAGITDPTPANNSASDTDPVVSIDAVNDGPTSISPSGGTTPSVIVNDTMTGAAAVIGTNVSLTPGASPNPGLTMNPSGTITVAAGTAPGLYVYPYTICTIPATTPPTCDTANATVRVPSIDAVNDGPTSVSASGGTTPSVIVNDTTNGVAAVIGTNVSLTPGASPNPGLTMNASGIITVAAGTAPGLYSYPYTICTIPATTPVTCDTAIATVRVPSIDAVNDGPTTVSASGGTTPSVIVNDTTNGVAAVIGTNVSLTPGASPNPGLTMNASGTITVAAGTTPGTYSYPYTICTIPATTPATCDTATATVVVPSIDAVNDTPAPIGAGGGTTPSVIGNDTTNGSPAVIGTNVSLTPGTAPAPAAGSITMNPSGTITVAPGTTPGTYSYPYTICTIPATTPATCDTATATIVIPTIDAVNDGPTSVSASGGTTPSVIVNDTTNGVAAVIGTNVSLTPGASPNPGLAMNASGTITVAAGTTPGTYSYPYTICTIPATTPATCDTATATVVVPSIDAVNDAPPAIGQGGGTTPSVIGNDTTNGSPAVIGTNVSLTPGTAPAPAAGSIVMNPSGTITVAPGTTPGTYSYPYTICTIPATTPATCDTAAATVVVNPSIDAVDDGPTSISSAGGSAPSVIGNDTTNGSPAVIGTNVSLSPGASPNPGLTMNASGVITVAAGTTPGTYSYPYTICTIPATTPVTCDTATATVVVTPTIDAVNDGPTSISSAGGNTPSVIGNDTTNGSPAAIGTNVSLTPGASPNPGLTMNPSGTITVTAGTTPGTYSYPYTICTIPATTPATCDTATATVVVTPTIDAVNDGPTSISSAGGSTPSVIVNDTTNGSPAVIGTNVSLTPGASPNPGLTMNASGTITVAAGTTPGTYSYPYTICTIPATTPATCDTATATVVVTPSIDAVNDSPAPIGQGGGTTASVIGNDTTNGSPAVIGTNVSLTPGASPNPGLTMNPSGTITVAAGTTPGTYSYPYTICTIPATTPATCDTATATVVVNPSIDAVNDGPTYINAVGGTTPSVIGNDTTNSVPAVIGGNVSLSPGLSPSPGLVMNADGTIAVAAGTTPGTYVYPYTICTIPATTPATCDTATATVVVPSIDAVNDSSAPIGQGGGTTPSVIVNDTTSGSPAVIGTNVALSPGTAPTPAAGSISMNPGGTITVAPGTTPGTYSYPYTICTIPATVPATCDTAIATVVVNPSIDAVDDGPTSVSAAGGTTPSVIVNDTTNGSPAVIGTNVSLTPGTAPTPTAGSITMNASGIITVTAGTTPGTYSYPYTICTIPATTPATCDTAIATVVVTPTIDAVNDGPTSISSAGGNTPSVVVNDTTNGSPAVIGTNVSLTPGASPNPGLTMNPDGTITVAAGTAPGTYAYPYTICTIPATTPATCDTATATVIVTPTIDAVNDGPTSISSAGGNTPSVIGNDTTNGVAAVIGTNVSLTPGASPNPGLTMNPSGTITVAAGTAPGTYSYPYTICTIPATTPATCDTATATVIVSPTIDAVNDGPTSISSAGGNTPSVIVNDTTNGSPAVIGTNVSLTPGASPNPGLTMNPSGTITVAAGTAPGTYSYPYTICTIPATTPATCDTATATVIVTPTIDAVNDGPTSIGQGGGNTPSVITNDTTNGMPAVIGTNVSLTPGAAPTPTAGSIVMNPDGTITVASGTTPGTYSYPYTICTIPATTPATCDTATATVVVQPNPQADLAVSKTNGVTAVNVGGTTIYTVRATNNGPASVTGAILQDPVAAGLVKMAVVCSGTPGQCTAPTTPNVAQLEAGYALPTLASGQFYEIQVAASVTATSGIVTNTVTVSTPPGVDDPNPTDNNGFDTDNVTPVADLSIVKTGPSTVTGGAAISYTLVITNNGPSAANGATYNDPLPNGITAVAATCGLETGGAVCGTQPGVSGTGPFTVAGVIATLPSGGSVTITINGMAPPGPTQTLVNTATTAPPGGTNDPNGGNNTSTTSTTTPVGLLQFEIE